MLRLNFALEWGLNYKLVGLFLNCKAFEKYLNTTLLIDIEYGKESITLTWLSLHIMPLKSVQV